MLTWPVNFVVVRTLFKCTPTAKPHALHGLQDDQFIVTCALLVSWGRTGDRKVVD